MTEGTAWLSGPFLMGFLTAAAIAFFKVHAHEVSTVGRALAGAKDRAKQAKQPAHTHKILQMEWSNEVEGTTSCWGGATTNHWNYK